MTKRFLLIYEQLLELGGLEKLMCTHAKYLQSVGYKVKLLFGSIDKELLKNEMYQGLDIEEYGPSIQNKTLKLLSSIILKNKLSDIIQPDDILISYSFPVNITIRKFINQKIIYMNHFPNFLYLPIKERWIWANNLIRKISFFYSLIFGGITKYYDKKYVKKSDMIFMNSMFTKKRLDSLYHINGVLSYPPVDTIFKYTPSNETLKKYNINGKYLFASGRLIKDKHINLLLESYAKSSQNLPLIVSGKGTELENLQSLTIKLNIEDKVKFIGFVSTEELINLYSMAEAYLMPTKAEDYGLGTAQAISCGTPLVVWDDGGGSCEQCLDDVNGYKAKPYDTEDFARCMDRCLKEDFKNKHSKEILVSAEVFREEEQKDIFLNNIKKLLS